MTACRRIKEPGNPTKCITFFAIVLEFKILYKFEKLIGLNLRNFLRACIFLIEVYGRQLPKFAYIVFSRLYLFNSTILFLSNEIKSRVDGQIQVLKVHYVSRSVFILLYFFIFVYTNRPDASSLRGKRETVFILVYC